jgi:hypothetical protein
MQLIPSPLAASEAAGRDDVEFDFGYTSCVGERAGPQDLPLSFYIDLSEATFFMVGTMSYGWSNFSEKRAF